MEEQKTLFGKVIKPPKPPVDRLIVAETVYHQRARHNPTAFDSRFHRELVSNEQPYSREQTVTEDWKPLDTGWIESCAMVCVKNLAGQFLSRNPTPEVKAEIAAQIVEVSSGGAPWIVYPGESMRGCPLDAKSLMVRCQKGTTKISTYLVPG